jgi:hypothetical protein
MSDLKVDFGFTIIDGGQIEFWEIDFRGELIATVSDAQLASDLLDALEGQGMSARVTAKIIDNEHARRKLNLLKALNGISPGHLGTLIKDMVDS